jgi:photosystem II stability/assembly factor-like uncharacterized protein
MNTMLLSAKPIRAVRQCAIATTLALTAIVGVAPMAARADTALSKHVAARMPVVGPTRELSAMRPASSTSKHPPATRGATHAWRLQQTLPGAVVHDIAFPTAATGFAAAELGQVWRTTNGGDHWDRIMNLGFPYYWYGVAALDADHVVVSGFNNTDGTGIVRWSDDGGDTWSDDVIVNDVGWLMRVRFADASNGLAVDLTNGSEPNGAQVTNDGGATADDWTSLVVDPDGGWFGNQFSLLPDGHARMSGITYCDSANYGAAWTCGPPVDPTFDGPVFFVDESNGWVGGGEISPDVAGWAYRTTDGGATWSDRTLDSPWPIRELLFVSPTTGWATGGNIYSGEGGAYFSDDGGATWSPDLDSEGREIDACANVGERVWCAGYDASFDGAVYVLDLVDDAVFDNGFDPPPGG